MSWETLIVGSMTFRNAEDMDDLLDVIRERLELSETQYGFFEEKIEGNTYRFKHLNWVSHVDEETVEKLLRDIEGYLEAYEVSLYYLDHGAVFYKRGDEAVKHEIGPW